MTASSGNEESSRAPFGLAGPWQAVQYFWRRDWISERAASETIELCPSPLASEG